MFCCYVFIKKNFGVISSNLFLVGDNIFEYFFGCDIIFIYWMIDWLIFFCCILGIEMDFGVLKVSKICFCFWDFYGLVEGFFV